MSFDENTEDYKVFTFFICQKIVHPFIQIFKSNQLHIHICYEFTFQD